MPRDPHQTRSSLGSVNSLVAVARIPSRGVAPFYIIHTRLGTKATSTRILVAEAIRQSGLATGICRIWRRGAPRPTRVAAALWIRNASIFCVCIASPEWTVSTVTHLIRSKRRRQRSSAPHLALTAHALAEIRRKT